MQHLFKVQNMKKIQNIRETPVTQATHPKKQP